MRRRDWSAFIIWCGPVSDHRIAAIGNLAPLSDEGLESAPLNVCCQDPPFGAAAEVSAPEAQHLELEEALERHEEILNSDDEPMNPRLHVMLHVVIANQLLADKPPRDVADGAAAGRARLRLTQRHAPDHGTGRRGRLLEGDRRGVRGLS